MSEVSLKLYQIFQFDKSIRLCRQQIYRGRLEEKISIGELLELKAKGQNLKLAESAVGADEAYTYDWALNTAEVNRLLSA